MTQASCRISKLWNSVFHAKRECVMCAPMITQIIITQSIGASTFSTTWKPHEMSSMKFSTWVTERLSIYLSLNAHVVIKFQVSKLQRFVQHVEPPHVLQNVMINLCSLLANVFLLETSLRTSRHKVYKDYEQFFG
jgi:hypothetical protein